MKEREIDALRMLCACLLDVGRYETARDLLGVVIALRPEDLFARRNLVRSLLLLGEYQRAEPIARELSETAEGPDRPAALFFHAHSLWGCDRPDECGRAVRKYLEAFDATRRGAAKKDKSRCRH